MEAQLTPDVSMCSLLGGIVPLPRVLWAMASDGLLFKPFSKVHPKYKTPMVATLFSGFLFGKIHFNPGVQIMFEYLHSTDIHRLDIIYNSNLLVLTTAVCSPDRCHLRPGRAGGLHVHWNPAGLYHGVRLRHHSQIQTSISNFIYPSTSHCQDHYC